MTQQEQIELAQSLVEELGEVELLLPTNITFRSDRSVVCAKYAQKYYERHRRSE